MAGNKKGAYKKSEDMANAVVIPSHKERMKSTADYEPSFIRVDDFPEEGQSSKYECGVYTALASGTMMGQGEGAIIVEAARLTKIVEQANGSFESAISQLNNGVTGVVAATVKRAAPEKKKVKRRSYKPDESHEVTAEPEEPDVANKLPPSLTDIVLTEESSHVITIPTPETSKTAEQELLDLLPKVKVSFRGTFGAFQTRYHEVDNTGTYLVLLFDQRCKIADMYSPPPMRGVMEVAVGLEEGESKYFHVMSLGISFELKKRSLYIISMPIVPEDHPLVQEYLSTQQEEAANLSPFIDMGETL